MLFQNPDIEIIRNKKLFIFDMDGTLCLGGLAIGGAVSFTEHLRRGGGRIMFFTNNSSHTPDFFAAKLLSMGFDVRPGEVVTSADTAAWFLLRCRPGCSVYTVLTDEVSKSLAGKGIVVAGENEQTVDAVLSGFDTELTYGKLRTACRYLTGGAEFFSTHQDLNCPTENGMIPDSGAISAFLTASTGRCPQYFGKPHSASAEMIRFLSGLEFNEMCVFGDRLYTDIAFGKKHGMTSVLVLTGETSAEDLRCASSDQVPDFVYGSLEELDRLL